MTLRAGSPALVARSAMDASPWHSVSSFFLRGESEQNAPHEPLRDRLFALVDLDDIAPEVVTEDLMPAVHRPLAGIGRNWGRFWEKAAQADVGHGRNAVVSTAAATFSIFHSDL